MHMDINCALRNTHIHAISRLSAQRTGFGRSLYQQPALTRRPAVACRLRDGAVSVDADAKPTVTLHREKNVETTEASWMWVLGRNEREMRTTSADSTDQGHRQGGTAQGPRRGPWNYVKMFIDFAIEPRHCDNFDDVVKPFAAKKAREAFLNKWKRHFFTFYCDFSFLTDKREGEGPKIVLYRVLLIPSAALHTTTFFYWRRHCDSSLAL